MCGTYKGGEPQRRGVACQWLHFRSYRTCMHNIVVVYNFVGLFHGLVYSIKYSASCKPVSLALWWLPCFLSPSPPMEYWITGFTSPSLRLLWLSMITLASLPSLVHMDSSGGMFRTSKIIVLTLFPVNCGSVNRNLTGQWQKRRNCPESVRCRAVNFFALCSFLMPPNSHCPSFPAFSGYISHRLLGYHLWNHCVLY